MARYQPLAYAYQAALICPDCAESLMAQLPKPDYPEPWDTNDWPYPTWSSEDVEGEYCDSMEDCPNRETRYRRDQHGRFTGGVYYVGCALVS